MNGNPLVSVVMIFLNSERFLQEAIESVFAQTYRHWELLLVDDGSTDTSTDIARRYAAPNPGQVRYLEHPGHQHRGASATRQLGIDCARGSYIAFLDSDDVWLPHKLEQQVDILDTQPKAGMLYGNTLYWYSWTGRPEDSRRDYLPKLGVLPGRSYMPPVLLSLYLRGKAAVPCTCSVLVRRALIKQTGGFETIFYDNVDDQVFYAKLCLAAPVFVASECWDKYRQHPSSSTAVAARQGKLAHDYVAFLRWLEAYLAQLQITDREVRQALRRQLWYYGRIESSGMPASTQRWVKRVKKWILRLEEHLVPERLRQWIWLRESGHE